MNYLKQLDSIKDELEKISKLLPTLPEGRISIRTPNGVPRYRGTLNGDEHYFTKEELPLVKQLIFRRYLELRQRDLIVRQRALLKATRVLSGEPGKADDFLLNNPIRADLIKDMLYEINEPAFIWMSAPSSTLAPHQEKRTEPTVAGYNVRSKSEVLIISVFNTRHLYYRYEDPLTLGGRIFYPDFSIYIPDTHDIIWYEHFGMMDDPLYAKRTYDKLGFYSKHGIIQGINLITTFETSDEKLNIDKINAALDTIL